LTHIHIAQHTPFVRRRLFLIACALVVLAFAGLRQIDDHSVEMSGTAASSQLVAKPAPEPSLPAVVPEATSTSPTTPTPLTPGSHRHVRPVDTAAPIDRPASHATLGTTRPLTFPLLI
jgi:hypothetical protein